MLSFTNLYDMLDKSEFTLTPEYAEKLIKLNPDVVKSYLFDRSSDFELDFDVRLPVALKNELVTHNRASNSDMLINIEIHNISGLFVASIQLNSEHIGVLCFSKKATLLMSAGAPIKELEYAESNSKFNDTYHIATNISNTEIDKIRRGDYQVLIHTVVQLSNKDIIEELKRIYETHGH